MALAIIIIVAYLLIALLISSTCDKTSKNWDRSSVGPPLVLQVFFASLIWPISLIIWWCTSTDQTHDD